MLLVVFDISTLATRVVRNQQERGVKILPPGMNFVQDLVRKQDLTNIC